MIAWIEDNECTPMLVAHADVRGVSVPKGYAKDGMITFNISSQAVQGLVIDAEAVRFGARFGGRHFDVCLPLASLEALFAHEHPSTSGVSLVAEARECADEYEKRSTQGSCGKKKGPPNLRLVE